ncbi:MAG: GNAT family N-acetyltransferase [Armatimonadetes bacterium]|nr:GNAT family N-acetyltransferase [Armatimonadota bacterium]
MSVRDYGTADKDAVVEIVRVVYEEYGFGWEPEGYHLDLFDIPRHYQHDDGAFWCAEDDGRVIGCGGVLAFASIPGRIGELTEHDGQTHIAGCDCELMRLYVHPAERRKGAGTALLRQIVVDAARRGCTSMEIWSDKTLKDAHKLYERFGAVTVGERICPPPDLMPEWGMALDVKMCGTLGEPRTES